MLNTSAKLIVYSIEIIFKLLVLIFYMPKFWKIKYFLIYIDTDSLQMVIKRYFWFVASLLHTKAAYKAELTLQNEQAHHWDKHS